MSERKPMTPAVTKHRFSKIAASVCGHLLATTTFFVLFSSLFVTEQSLGLLKVGVRDEMLRPDIMGPGVLLFGLAGCVWALAFIIYQLAKSHMTQAKHVSLKKARGTVITETLVVFPVFLCLTFGLAQMAMNSIAGILSTLASYEVTRTLAVWAVEEGNNRSPSGTVSREHIRDRARLVAASIIAPVTPELASGLTGCSQGSALPSMLQGLVGAGLAPAAAPALQIKSMAEGYGASRFIVRGPTKLSLAYCAIDVTWTNVNTDTTFVGRSPITASLAYNHPISMPAVGWVFATDPGAGPWATPYVSIIRRQYRMTTYLTPNTYLPQPGSLFGAP